MSAYALRFNDLHREGHGYSFPCDAKGNVDTEGMTETMYRNYARVLSRVGLDYATPQIIPQ